MGILHQVQVRSGISVREGAARSGWLFGTCAMIVILSEGFRACQSEQARGKRHEAIGETKTLSSVAIAPPWLIGIHCSAVKPSPVKEFFRGLPAKFDAEAAEDLAAVYQFDLSGPQGGQYHVKIKDGACSVHEGTHPEPQVTFSMSGDDCVAVLSGRLDGSSVFLSGRLQISGDLGLAMQLRALFPTVR